MEEMCRCCLKTDISLIEIPFEEEEKFQNCTGNKNFNKNDGLAQSCCRCCYKKINDIYIFQKECKEADLFLKKLVLKNNIKDETNKVDYWMNLQSNDNILKIENIDNNIIDNPIEEILQIVNYEENKYLDENLETSLNFESNFTCNACEKSFKSKKNLNIHYTIAHKKNPDNKSFKCRLCEYKDKNKIFGSERNLKIHLARKHQAEKRNGIDSNTNILENRLLKCRFCDNNFKEQSLLLKHLQINHLKKSEIIAERELSEKLETQKTLLTFYEPKSNKYNHIKRNIDQIVRKDRKENFNKNNLNAKYRKVLHASNYYCDLCGVKFVQKQLLVTHFKVKHLQIMEFTCKLCWKGFVSYNLFHAHLIKIHIKQNIKSVNEVDQYLINNETEHSNSLWKNLKISDMSNSNEIENKYSCRLCDKRLVSEMCLKLHFSSVHLKLTNIAHKCNICWKLFRFKYSLTRHRKIHNLILKYNCKLCGLAFITKSLFLCHLRYTHLKKIEDISSDYTKYCVLKNKNKIVYYQWPKKNSTENKFAIQLIRHNCDYCNNTFATKYALKVHLKQKHEKYIVPNKLECSICNKIFPKHNLFRNHMKENHPGEYSLQIQVNCTICNKSYTKKSIKNHLKTHQNRPKHIQCPECGRTFFSQSTYNYHQKTHTNEKPFKCDHCTKAFITKYQLVMHSITHSDKKRPKRYQCNYCGKGCASTSEFTVHLRIHTKERPFKCTQCDKGFLTKSHLRNHFVTHTGEKNYKCKEDGCKSAYGSVSSLKKHYYMVHCPEEQKKFQCDLCLKKFGRRTFLNQHRKAHGKIAKVRKN